MVVIAPSLAHVAPAHGSFLATSWAEFEASGNAPLGFYLAGWSPEQTHEITLAIRRSAHWHCLVLADDGGSRSPLVDGVVEAAEAAQAVTRTASLHRSLDVDTSTLHFDERLLHFLYLRDPGELVPRPDRSSKSLYTFPVA